MCGIGICCHILNCGRIQTGLKVLDVSSLKNRGPDVQNSQACALTGQVFASELIGCTLHLRGTSPVKQPLQAANGSKLLWNGEIFSSEVSADENDTMVLMKLLEQSTDVDELLSVFSKLHGPWAFIYWQARTQRLWFGRDMFGRRSLLWKHTCSPQFIFALSSVACRPHTAHDMAADSVTENWYEVPAYGIYCWHLSSEKINDKFVPLLYPWSFFLNNHFIDSSNVANNGDPFAHVSIQSERLPAPVSAEFNQRLPTAKDLDFYSSALRWTADKEGQGLRNIHENVFRAIETAATRDLVERFEKTLQSAVDIRVRSCPNQCQTCIQSMVARNDFGDGIRSLGEPSSNPCSHTKIAVLFSGGLDSTVLALLVHRCLPPEETIDLLNVAFEQSCASAKFDVPDRISGHQSFAELQELAPERSWNFVEIDVTKAEMERESHNKICDLIYPLTTVLDNDIGCAVWFAARGKGLVTVDGKHLSYTSTARVVLTGMGADEQLAGYSRHRICFKRNGWTGLIAELKMEIDRIASRNLGRDDRVISDHGREARFPFLDEKVVSFLNSLPMWYKANLDLPRGIGDKFLLRWMAERLQLKTATNLAKRAIQFGSRIAKMEKNRKGTDTCEKLKAVQT